MAVRVGHRGAAGHILENTLGSIERAMVLGADMVELDLRATSDGQLVVFHDARLERLTGRPGNVSDFRLADLQTIRLRDGQGIPTLKEALEFIDGRLGVILEMKSPGMARMVYRTVQAQSPRAVIYASFHHAELLVIRQLEASAATMALLEGVPIRPTAFASDAQVTHVGLALDVVVEGFVRALQQQNFQVFVYTVNHPDDIGWIRSMGVQGLISDFPDRI